MHPDLAIYFHGFVSLSTLIDRFVHHLFPGYAADPISVMLDTEDEPLLIER